LDAAILKGAMGWLPGDDDRELRDIEVFIGAMGLLPGDLATMVTLPGGRERAALWLMNAKRCVALQRVSAGK
jgi:hypothetical protein